MKAFWAFILALVWKMLGWQVNATKHNQQDGQGPGDLENDLNEQIKKDGWDDEKAHITDPVSKS